jgi:hypothetical protein
MKKSQEISGILFESEVKVSDKGVVSFNYKLETNSRWLNKDILLEYKIVFKDNVLSRDIIDVNIYNYMYGKKEMIGEKTSVINFDNICIDKVLSNPILYYEYKDVQLIDVKINRYKMENQDITFLKKDRINLINDIKNKELRKGVIENVEIEINYTLL